jgi:group I intron endonuclease
MKNKIKILFGVYLIKNKINGKIYIGSSNNIRKRWNEHKNDLRNDEHHSKHLQKSYKKYGIENFEFLILEEVQSAIGLFALEQQYLDKHRPFDRNIGYNISETAIGPTGVVRNDLKRFNIENKSKKVYQYSLNGVFLKKWNSVTEAASFYKKGKSDISRNCLKKTIQSFGYIWRYDYIENLDINEIKNKNKRKITQLTIDNVVIKEWESITEASKFLKINASKICSVCSGQRKTSGGFVWQYKK